MWTHGCASSAVAAAATAAAAAAAATVIAAAAVDTADAAAVAADAAAAEASAATLQYLQGARINQTNPSSKVRILIWLEKINHNGYQKI